MLVSAPPMNAASSVEAPKRGVSLRLKLTLGLILIIGILFAGTNTFNLWQNRQRQRDEAIAHNETISLLVAGALIPELGNNDIDSERFKNFAGNFLYAALMLSKKNRDLAFAVVADSKGHVVAGRAKTNITVFPAGKTIADEAEALNAIARLDGKLGGDMRVIRFPLVVGGKGSVGRLYVGTSLARIVREARRDLIINISILGATLLVLVIYASLALGRLVIRPITQVATAMRAVQEGNLEHELTLKSRDEIGMLAGTYNFMVRGLRERAELQDAFSRYVSPQVYERFKSGSINLRGEMRKATVLFSDIRSFTTLSEQLTPVEVVAMLNEYFTEMVEIVFKYDGFVNKFIGDAIMAVYNIPIDQDQPEMRAVRTAIEMTQALDRLNQRRLARGQFAIKIGIGINTGPVVAGNLGHERRLEYTVIGDAVNLAQRLESQTKVTGTPILISQATFEPCAQYLVAQQLPPVKVKGKNEPVVLYAVSALRDEDDTTLSVPTPASATSLPGAASVPTVACPAPDAASTLPVTATAPLAAVAPGPAPTIAATTSSAPSAATPAGLPQRC